MRTALDSLSLANGARGNPWSCQSRIVMNIFTRMEQIDVLRIKLEMLRREHRDLDVAIHALQERGSADMLTVRRLKKQKLLLKDQITQLADRILPDIIA